MSLQFPFQPRGIATPGNNNHAGPRQNTGFPAQAGRGEDHMPNATVRVLLRLRLR
jgi:hypothetical protein